MKGYPEIRGYLLGLPTSIVRHERSLNTGY